MTLTTETVRVQYAGDGTTTAFAVTFIFWNADDLQVVLTDSDDVETTWTRGTQYTVSGGSGSTGTVTVATSPTDYTPASGETLTIISNLDDKQNTSLPAGGAFPSASVEEQLDKIVRLIQQKAEALGRAIKFAVSSADSDVSFPDITGNAEKLIRVNAAGTRLEAAALTSIDGSAITVPVTIAQGGTNATTAAAARTSLGLGTAATKATGTASGEVPLVGTASATDALAGLIETATQAEQETGTATDKAVTPGRQHFHQSAAKVWGKAGVTGNLLAGYNVDSITDAATGQAAVVFTTDFSSAEYSFVLTLVTSSPLTASTSSVAAGTLNISSLNTSGVLTDPNAYSFAGYGDQA